MTTTRDIDSLSKEVKRLTTVVQSQASQIRALEKEIPGNFRKLARLGIDEAMLKHDEPRDGEQFWSADRVRDTFVSFFEKKQGHVNYKSAPVVPFNDPTLLFINSGMAQFKPIFLGQVSPTSPLSGLKRVCNSQKCIRAGGKHNDLDDVGKDSYHHTFFEMLGNWSFGDYFKQDAIRMAWTLLTDVYKIPEDRLYVTYFMGSETVPEDLESKEIWKQYIDEDRILPFDGADNFWEMGATGPCGPCSEIHYDRVGNRDASKMVNMDDPEVIEIWNLVFMQFNRKADGSLEKLPDQHVDTGMGFERVVSLLQNKQTNYDTDVFAPIFAAIEQKTDGLKYNDRYFEKDPDQIDMAFRVVADHIRTLTVAVADGAVPSNEGRGYVLRRIIRRAVRYSREILKLPKNSFSEFVPIAIKSLETAFPEMKKRQSYVMEVIKEEEVVFERTLSKGVDHFRKQSARLLEQNIKVVPGQLAFKLYESMGFPSDLTQLMAEEKGMTVDMEAYDECWKQHVEVSKQRKSSDEFVFKVFEAKETSALEDKDIPKTVSSFYTEENVNTQVLAIYDAKNEKFIDSIDEKSDKQNKFGVILKESSMYFESGGQVGDNGIFRTPTGEYLFQVEDVQHAKGYVIHIGKPLGTLAVGKPVICAVNYNKRDKIAKNHSATHILNWGLRNVLTGTEVDQAGSLVNDEYLRFDFSCKRPLKTEEIKDLELLLQGKIEKSEKVDTEVVALADAKKINALRAVFGETYPDPVRVVAVGCKINEVLASPEDPKWNNFSIELCGGTHVANSSVLKKLVVMSEEAKGKNIRRMVCLTEEKAIEACGKAETLFSQVESCQDSEIKSLTESISSNTEVPLTKRRELVELLNKKKMQLLESEKQAISSLTNSLTETAKEKKSAGQMIQYVVLDSELVSAPKIIRPLSKAVKDVSFIVLVRNQAGSSVAFSITKEHIAKVNGEKLFSELKEKSSFKGGGKPLSLAGTCNDPDKTDEISEIVANFTSKLTL